ncbi:hypothetical protein D9619_003672 [Psilocybe cf. subviscida]|uniref:F-box domain-containing protein n=1 Tax=Psilocybe cf. subviscida TaxID=2480587 RepID=A0A8H5AXM0_9AGAR|nr:hypothetical protein D9619_003672 [Psilocybe cf. subviscida]
MTLSHVSPFKLGQRITLLDLAPELITLICKSSEDLDTVFALKNVCRNFNTILNDWTIWAHLVSTCLYSPSTYRRHLFVDRPISTHSACELKAMLMRWKKVERGWKRAHRQDFDVRRLSLPDDLIAPTRVLAPGGRWLLLFSADLAASYFDLDSDCIDMETPSPFPLIPPHNPYGATSLHVSDPDVDQASPVISFRIALTYVGGNDMAEGPSFVEIWTITSLYDSNTKTSRLGAQKVAAFQLNLACGLLDIYTLAGDSILFAAPYMFFHTPEYESGDRRFLYVNWRKAVNNSHQPCYRTVSVPARVRVLSPPRL